MCCWLQETAGNRFDNPFDWELAVVSACELPESWRGSSPNLGVVNIETVQIGHSLLFRVKVLLWNTMHPYSIKHLLL